MPTLSESGYSVNKSVTWREGDNRRDMDLSGFMLDHKWGALVAVVDMEKYGNDAPLLPVTYEYNDHACGPWRKCGQDWICTEHVIHLGVVYSRKLTWTNADVEKYQSKSLSIQSLSMRLYQERMRQFRRKHHEAIMRHHEAIVRHHEAS